MRLFWSQAGLHLEPQTYAELVALQRFQEAFTGLSRILVETYQRESSGAECSEEGGTPGSARVQSQVGQPPAQPPLRERGWLPTAPPDSTFHAAGCGCGNCPSLQCTEQPIN